MVFTTSDSIQSGTNEIKCFKIKYLILGVAFGLLLHVNFFEDYADEPYLAEGGSAVASVNDNIHHSQLEHSVSSFEKASPATNFSNVQISDLIDTETFELKVDVADVIDFAMIGNPKTGTSFMSSWIRKHPDLLTPKAEMRAMKWPTGPGRSMQIMSNLIQQKAPPKKLGYKCPADVRLIESLANLRDYFPRTKLIIGMLNTVK